MLINTHKNNHYCKNPESIVKNEEIIIKMIKLKF